MAGNILFEMVTSYPTEKNEYEKLYSTYALMQSRYAKHRGYILVKEAQAIYHGESNAPSHLHGNPYQRQELRRFDYIAIPIWGYRDSVMIFEEKTTVEDLRREFKNDYAKSKCARDWASQFYLILPAEIKTHKIIKEIPGQWGILYKYEKTLRRWREAHYTDNNLPRWMYGNIFSKYLWEQDNIRTRREIEKNKLIKRVNNV